METQFKIGELAKRAGVSVRTLHHYDELGLLSPSLRTEAGHRLYSSDDVFRLQQIISLRSLAFSLEEIAAFLKSPEQSPVQVLQMHLNAMQQELKERQKLVTDLEALILNLQSGSNPSVDELLNLMEGINMIQKYYSKEQLDYLQERANILGEDKIKEVEAEWPQLIEKVRQEMLKGTDPRSETVLALAKRWQELIEMFTGGNAGVAQSLGNMYQQEGAAKASRGVMDDDVGKYISQAFSALK
jgi:DNA-binding transcriptional MerR regulator